MKVHEEEGQLEREREILTLSSGLKQVIWSVSRLRRAGVSRPQLRLENITTHYNIIIVIIKSKDLLQLEISTSSMVLALAVFIVKV